MSDDEAALDAEIAATAKAAQSGSPTLPRDSDTSWLPDDWKVTRPAPATGSVSIGMPGLGHILFEPTESGRLVATEAYDTANRRLVSEGPPDIQTLVSGMVAPENALEAAGDQAEGTEEVSGDELPPIEPE